MTPSSEELNILLLTDRVPGSDSGYGIRISNVVEGLKKVGTLHVCLVDSSDVGVSLDGDRGYTTSVIRAANPTNLQKALALASTQPTSVRYRRAPALRAAIERTLGEQQWDLVWCSRVRVHQVSRSIVSDIRIVDFDDLGDQLLLSEIRDRSDRHGWLRTLPRNLVGLVDVARWRHLQRTIAAEVDRVLVCSTVDVRTLGLPNVAVMPNGYPVPADDATARTLSAPPSLLFVGPMTYEPNRLAVEWLLTELMPRIRRGRLAKCNLVVVGDNRGVKVHGADVPWARFEGWVPDIGPYYDRATVAVTPLHSGGGTRLKVIEALARSTPLVSTSFGCQGLDLDHGRELLVADDPDAFAQACVEVIMDPALRRRLVTAGRKRYDADLTSRTAARAVTQMAMTELRPSPRMATDGR